MAGGVLPETKIFCFVLPTGHVHTTRFLLQKFASFARDEPFRMILVIFVTQNGVYVSGN